MTDKRKVCSFEQYPFAEVRHHRGSDRVRDGALEDPAPDGVAR
jgi:hypothetical protein